MGIFLRRHHGHHGGYQQCNYGVPAVPRAAAPMAAAPVTPPPAAPVVPPPVAGLGNGGAATPAAQPAGGLSNLLAGLSNNFTGGKSPTAAIPGLDRLTQALGGGLLQSQGVPEGVGLAEALRAQKGVQLSPEERQQVAQASGVLERLAGADGLWNRGDLNNNVRQLEASGDLRSAVHDEIGRRWGQELSQRGPLGRMLVNGHMNRNYGKYENQGMQQARGMARDQLAEGIKQGGADPSAGHDAKKAAERPQESAQAAGKPISRAEMEQFKGAMDMLQKRSEEQGLPKVSFPNGVPVDALKAMAAGKSPQEAVKEAGGRVTWSNGKVTDYGKKQDAPGDGKTGAAGGTGAGQPAATGAGQPAAAGGTGAGQPAATGAGQPAAVEGTGTGQPASTGASQPEAAGGAGGGQPEAAGASQPEAADGADGAGAGPSEAAGEAEAGDAETASGEMGETEDPGASEEADSGAEGGDVEDSGMDEPPPEPEPTE